jgi:hypothetical protein
MSFSDWMTVLQFLLGGAAVLFVAVLFAVITGRLNAPGDDDPETIIARPAMNPDDNDWGRL